MSRLRFLVLAVFVVLLAACSQAAVAPSPAPQATAPSAVSSVQATPTVALSTGTSTSDAYQKALSCVTSQLPAEKYMTNEYLPTGPVDGPTPGGPGKLRKVKVGLSWVLNDEHAMFYNAVALGYFKDEGLDVELVAGGPGLDHIQTLGGGAVDIAVSPAGSSIPFAVASKTPIDIVAVGTILKGGPGVLLTVDPDLTAKERGDLTPKDLIGRTVTVQNGSDIYINMLLDKNGISRDQVKITTGAGFMPDALLTKPPEANFYLGWVMNQPRVLQKAGLTSKALSLRDWSYNEYGQTISVRRQTLSTQDGQDMVRRFLRATVRGTRYLLDHPAESAKYTVSQTAADIGLTEDQALWRFNAQEYLIVGVKDAKAVASLRQDTKKWETAMAALLQMDPKEWNDTMATYLQYNQLQLNCK